MEFLKVKKIFDDAVLPTRSNPTDAGLDFYATGSVSGFPGAGLDYYDEGFDYIVIYPGDRVVIGTGVSVAVPANMAMFLWDRSGLAARYGLHRFAGVVDSDYRGEVKVVLANLGDNSYKISHGDKIIQAVITPIYLPKVAEIGDLGETIRGEDGFGSTGF